MKELGTSEAAEITGLSERAVRNYAGMGLCGSDPGGKGRGRVARFSEADIIALLFVRLLAERGVTIESILKITAWLQAESAFLASWKGTHNVTDDDFTTPEKHWADFLDLDELQSKESKLFITVFDARSEKPIAGFSRVKKGDAVLDYEDFDSHSDCLVVDLKPLYDLIRKL